MHGNLVTRELAVGLFSFLSLVLSHTGNDLKILGENRYIHTQDLTESNRHKETARKRSEQTQVQPLCPVRAVKKSKCLSLSLPGFVR